MPTTFDVIVCSNTAAAEGKSESKERSVKQEKSMRKMTRNLSKRLPPPMRCLLGRNRCSLCESHCKLQHTNMTHARHKFKHGVGFRPSVSLAHFELEIDVLLGCQLTSRVPPVYLDVMTRWHSRQNAEKALKLYFNEVTSSILFTCNRKLPVD